MAEVKRITYILIALFLICVGFFGLILPIVNGFLLILLGLILISFESRYVKYHLERIAKKNAHVEKWYIKIDSWMQKIFR